MYFYMMFIIQLQNLSLELTTKVGAVSSYRGRVQITSIQIHTNISENEINLFIMRSGFVEFETGATFNLEHPPRPVKMLQLLLESMK